MTVDFVQGAIYTIREWMVKNINVQALKFPDEDQVWEFITGRWSGISTENAEHLLCEAMRPIY